MFDIIMIRFSGSPPYQTAIIRPGRRSLSTGFILIGAGTLKAPAYIPYGTSKQNICCVAVTTTGNTYSYPGNLVWVEDFNVATSGGCTIQGREVRVYSESDLKGEVDLKNDGCSVHSALAGSTAKGQCDEGKRVIRRIVCPKYLW
jgi:hypothetical protein